MTNLSIVQLRDHPDALDSVAQWIDQEWGRFSGRSHRETRERFSREFATNGLPTSCVAIDAGVAVGVATLREHDSVKWDEHSTPWICNVYVRDEARGKGVGGRLCRALEIVAAELGYSRVHLATVMSADSLYHRLGYVRYRTYEALESPMYLMSRDLGR